MHWMDTIEPDLKSLRLETTDTGNSEKWRKRIFVAHTLNEWD